MRANRLQVLLLVGVVLVAIVTISAFSQNGKKVGPCTATGSGATSVSLLSASDAGDSTAIQKAIDQATASGGGIVQLSVGEFQINQPLVLRANVALKGSGPGTVLKATSRFLKAKGPLGGHPLITTNGSQNVTIADLTADQSGDVIDGNVSGRLKEYLVDVRNSTNAVVEGVATKNPFTYSIAVVGSSNFCVHNNSTVVATSGKYDQLDGIHITDSYSGLVVGNHVDQRQGEDGDDGLVAQTIGGTVHDVAYLENDVRGGSHGAAMQLAVAGSEIYNITIANNRFWGSPSGIRTGYYGGASKAVHDVTVKGNIFVDLEGASTDLSGQLENIQVTDNRFCRSGDFNVAAGPNNQIRGNVTSCEP
ncbi:glycosyl hydrolase family 28-related protein [Arthrobacter sp. fls2-241-R2A-200]|uniref:glycosyl hydrolase family 28-related protein n=1 Tax=unclassified Arthrobacter TaxID=235627 RepID=UPI00254B2434|nr:glycosyl hydrolase family 28-related protein [Arthrobacter sp. fls2-241-R2A-200]